MNKETVFDYLRWRGDIELSRSDFCCVDALVFCRLASLCFSGLVPEEFTLQGPLLSEVTADYASHSDPKAEGSWALSEEDKTFLSMVSASGRYAKVRLCGCIRHIDKNSETQFSAITFLPDSRHIFVAFGGTNNTLLGLKEDFNLSFSESIPGQQEAAAYLRRAMKHFFLRKAMVGGHSKGGNFAVYAAAFSGAHLQKRITAVYNLDGPGFLDSVLESEGYQRILPVLQTYVPQSSIIGMLLDQDENFRVIHSYGSNGVTQHFLFSWQVCGTDFVTEKERTGVSRVLDKAAEEWIRQMPSADRRQLVDTIFDLFEERGADSLGELLSWENFFPLMRSLNKLDASTKAMIQKSLRILVDTAKKG